MVNRGNNHTVGHNVGKRFTHRKPSHVPVSSLPATALLSPSCVTFQQQSGADTSTDTEGLDHSERRAAAGGNDGSQHAAQKKRHGLAGAKTAQQRGSSGGGGGGTVKRRPNKVVHCREAELLPAVYARLDSGDWRERLKGLEEVRQLACILLCRYPSEVR